MPTWKAVERQIAKLFGGTRTGPQGRAVEDVTAPGYDDWLAIEIKHKKSLPLWLKAALTQVEKAAGPDRLGLVVLHEHRMQYKESLVVLRLGDWFDYFGSQEPDDQWSYDDWLANFKEGNYAKQRGI